MNLKVIDEIQLHLECIIIEYFNYVLNLLFYFTLLIK